MIPEQLTNLTALEEKVIPTRTYRIDFTQNRIVGMVDGQEAMLQALQKLLQTERYAYPIYSGNYGVELERFVGQNYDFIVSDLHRTLWECLSADNRISQIGNYAINKTGLDTLEVSFLVYTIEGVIETQVEVSI